MKIRKARVQYLRSVSDDLFRFAVGVFVHIVGQPCLDDVVFLTVDGFCAESGILPESCLLFLKKPVRN